MILNSCTLLRNKSENTQYNLSKNIELVPMYDTFIYIFQHQSMIDRLKIDHIWSLISHNWLKYPYVTPKSIHFLKGICIMYPTVHN